MQLNTVIQIMRNLPEISVIIPTYGRQDHLLDCIESVVNGHYSTFEIIVVDQDAAQAVSKVLERRYANDSRIRYFCLENAGASRSRNFGISVARGSILAFIDDDAVADPGWLESIAETLSKAETPIALLAGRIYPIWSTACPAWYPKECQPLLGLYDIGDTPSPLPQSDQPISANMAGWRDTIQALGGFDERMGPNYFRKNPMITGEDTLLGLRAREKGLLVYYQPKTTVHHCISKLKLTKCYFLRRHFWEGATVINEMHLLGRLSSTPSLITFHFVRLSKAVVLTLVPFVKAPPRKYPVVWMLALSRMAYSLGSLYRLLEIKRETKAYSAAT